jgi:Sugar (pentulose and hexulose) kinases
MPGGGRDLVLACDVGTTSAKTCLYRIGGPSLELVASASEGYGLSMLPNGGVEQNPDDWWRALVSTSRAALASAQAEGSRVAGMAFCCQMQGLVLVDEKGQPLRPAMSYMDQRATEQRRRGIGGGLRVAGMDIRKLLPSLLITGGAPASVKDPLWKYRWMVENEASVLKRAAYWLDVKEYLVMHCTGVAKMTRDSANATFLYDTRGGGKGWSPRLCELFGVDMRLLPEVIGAAESVGPLRPESARELGLDEGIPVFGGGGDLSLIALGSGAVEPGRAHVYMGTSGWVAAVTDERKVDTDSFIAAVLGAVPGRYNYISELETAGKCLEWARDHLALDEIGVYLEGKKTVHDDEGRYASLFDFLSEKIEEVPPGAEGLMFAPWLHGNRSPFEDSNARGMFFNVGIGTGKRDMLRAVIEGTALHNRWQLESIRKKVRVEGPLRFVGGSARSGAIARILADVLGEKIETTSSPQNAGALGAALVCAAGLGAIPSLAEAGAMVPANATYEPRDEERAVYDRNYPIFKELYYANRRSFAALNSEGR